MGARHIKPSELIAVNKLLEKHLKKVDSPDPEENLVEYERGFDDAQIAKMVAGDLSPASVARLRTELHGRLLVRGYGVEARLTALEAVNIQRDEYIPLLDGNLVELTGKYNKLVETLAINKVADVRHLKVKADGS